MGNGIKGQIGPIEVKCTMTKGSYQHSSIGRMRHGPSYYSLGYWCSLQYITLFILYIPFLFSYLIHSRPVFLNLHYLPICFRSFILSLSNLSLIFSIPFLSYLYLTKVLQLLFFLIFKKHLNSYVQDSVLLGFKSEGTKYAYHV